MGNLFPDMQTRQCFKCWWSISMNAYDELLAGIADADASYQNADTDAI